MPARDREAIFELGFTRKPGGRGLGLHISREVLEKGGYTLQVDESGQDSGATFPHRAQGDPRDRAWAYEVNMSTSAFDRVSRQVASEFLNTVVLVDDQALLGAPPISASPGQLRTPGRQGRAAETAEANTTTNDSAHRLDAKRLTDGFARIGMVCAVLRPADQELNTLDQVLKPITAGSDVIILDWVLHEFKQGEKTLEINKGADQNFWTRRGRSATYHHLYWRKRS